jgi:hypothetical protein
MKINLNSILDVAKYRPAGYYEDVCSRGKIVDGYLNITPKDYADLLTKYGGTPTAPCATCGQNKPLPSVMERIRNVTHAAGRVADNLIHGEAIKVSAEVQEQRYKICAGCEFFNKEKNACSVCGCAMKAKTWLSTEACPKKLW